MTTEQTIPLVRSAKVTDTSFTELTLDTIRDVLQQAGYRVEQATDPVVNVSYLRSATGGVAFDIRPGNRLAGSDTLADVAFIAVMQVQGEFPLDVVNRWNVTRRFARLQLSAPFLALCFDVSAAGGVTASYLRAQIEIWDHLVQQLIAYLREELTRMAEANAAKPPVAAVPPKAEPPLSDTASRQPPSDTIQ